MTQFTYLDPVNSTNKYVNQSMIDGFMKKIKNEKIDSCLILHKNKIILEYYKNNKMSKKQHAIYSVTKSVLSALIGIAIQKGFIENVNVPIANYFTELHKSGTDQRKLVITIEHLLTMTAGLSWNNNKEMQMSKNWIKYILNRQVENDPGKSMNYCCGYSHLLSSILQKASGMDASSFAQKYLFGYLDIRDYRWLTDNQGICNGGFGLSMKAIDMLKIGSLFLNKGSWGSKQILSETWIEESIKPRFSIDDHSNIYGYHWWVLSDRAEQETGPMVFYASGYGGNYIIIVPEFEIVTVFTSRMFEESSKPKQLFLDYMLSAFQG
ncbi:serine hydrolase domain-containing protein [Caldalkalibacillus mannanilyticus]|uniref:serine hydrolase domain-containing protein n=1 Tax=Caldalkalibacillus mannanilyticus TaxID=1418 RepID=UPI000A431094|nr:serine hydrolase [Caldalkalibacillus mannanilyticus]